jgi:LysM repeat protein
VRRRSENAPYIIAFVVIIAVLVAFSYVGLDWATGRGRVLGLGATATPIAAPTPSPVSVVPSPLPSPVEERVYVVKAGDIPEEIARQFDVSVDALLRANGIKDPRTLQVGQNLKIPPPGTR